VDVKVPKDLPTRATIGKEISRAMLPVTKPIQDSLNETKSEIDSVKEEAGIKPKPATNPKMVPQPKTTPKPVTAETPETPPAPAINSAATEPVPSNGNGNGTSAPDFGTWSKKP
jgi:hypothetical protein